MHIAQTQIIHSTGDTPLTAMRFQK